MECAWFVMVTCGVVDKVKLKLKLLLFNKLQGSLLKKFNVSSIIKNKET